MKERSLVVFTLLAQLCVGALLILGILDLPGLSLLIHNLPGIGFLFALALLASLFHLGSPANAYRSAVNWRSSWLSREILSSPAFGGSLIVFFFASRSGLDSPALLQLVFLLASLIGLGLIYVMARVYMLRTVEAWNRWSTPASFYSAALFLGSLASGIGIILSGESAGLLTEIGVLASLAFALEVALWILSRNQSRSIPVPWRSDQPVEPDPAWRFGCAAAGLVSFEIAVLAASGENAELARLLLAMVGLALVFWSETLARSWFYQLRRAQII